MAYAAAASVLNDREKYRSFFRVLPSFDNLAPSVVAIMDQFRCTQMLVFTQDESLFVKVSGGTHINNIRKFLSSLIGNFNAQLWICV